MNIILIKKNILLILNRKINKQKLYEKNIVNYIKKFNNENFYCSIIRNKIYENLNKLFSCFSCNLKEPCFYGDLNIINFLIENNYKQWYSGLYGACKGGHKHIAEMMIKKGANNWNQCFRASCEGGQLELLKFIIEKGGDNYVEGFYEACANNNIEIIYFLMSKYKFSKENFSSGLYWGCINNYPEVVKLMLDNGASKCDYCYNKKHPELN